ncbi:MAG: hypothetical protein R2825_05410 [Saprospiraceae bacterium]
MAAPSTSQMTISGTGAVAQGTYNITVTGTSGGTNQSETVALCVMVGGAPGSDFVFSPPSGRLRNISQSPTLL